MNRDTRDKFASGTDQSDLTTGNSCWETAPAIFAKLNEDFGPFDIDLTADSQRHLCPIWFGPDSPLGEFDALIANWLAYGSNGYSNPPYGDFVNRGTRNVFSSVQGFEGARVGILAIAKLQAARGFSSTFLLPLRVTKAFKAHILKGASDLLFCDRRLIFWENGAPRLNPKTGKPDSALFDSIVVRYRPGVWTNGPTIGEWHVPENAPVGDYRGSKGVERSTNDCIRGKGLSDV